MQYSGFAPIACAATMAVACGIPANGTGDSPGAPSASSSSTTGGGSTLPILANAAEDASAASPGSNVGAGAGADASTTATEASSPATGGGGDAGGAAPGFDAAPGATPDASAAGSPYKGVIIYEEGTCGDLQALGVSWYGNWLATTHCPSNAQFVPQIWGRPNEAIAGEIATMVAGGSSVVLGFNEPDSVSGANLTVAQAAAQWPALDVPGLRLGSPATSSTSAGQTWMTQFMAQASQENLRVDFLALHWAGADATACSDASELESYIRWAEQWQKPIWLTEWSCSPSPSNAPRYWPVATTQDPSAVKAFYDDALAMFANHPLVERYGWYLSRGPNDAALISTTTGTLTPFGTDYAAAPATH